MRCLLVIAAWQAPLPFWHSHGTLATATPETAAWLTNHLRTHHPVIDPFSRFFFGWHLHFTVPESGDGTPDAPKSTRQQVVVGGGLGSWDAFTRLQSPLVSRACQDALIIPQTWPTDRGRNAFRRGGGFFTDFASDVPLPLRLGVMRC